ncbi:MAG: hypothetical protein EB078_12450 [Proteobacteria bacterium]|nr:hypothetical protein [Pseudomonadota bacterium]
MDVVAIERVVVDFYLELFSISAFLKFQSSKPFLSNPSHSEESKNPSTLPREHLKGSASELSNEP